ncbi:hypothetical protein [Longimicrobium terrae]|uniref:Uncharacterized protein n=1 Tax=Longimicrobium terrae TaxID=1639882 RepID=A0A841H0W1_9BACT|nr:hypothetical protein [Longimicrobium terrae]MBB4637090.1 hypothetical protein [Longimicrobium terrae]MBB6071650.1 hypothetical protein [Longimicrobium terrae]NNC29934.1 hypothetical protein [Longimicrobium terrae]
MHYEEQSRRLNILGGFALGVAFGAGVGLVLRPRGDAGAHSAAVRRARGIRAPAAQGRPERAATRGAAGRMARSRFRL